MTLGNLTIDILLRSLPAVYILSVFIFIACGAVQKLLPQANIAVRWCAAFIVGAWTASLCFHILLAFGAFTLTWACLVLTALALAGRTYLQFTPTAFSRAVHSDLCCWYRVLRMAGSSPYRPLAYVVFAIIIFTVARILILPVIGGDALAYHAVRAALWVKEGTGFSLQIPAYFSMHASFPGGYESLMAWLMLPFHSDLLLPLLDIAAWIFLAIAIIAICSELGIRGLGRWTAVTYLMLIPAVYLAVGTGKNDTALTVFISASFLFALRWLRNRNRADLIICFMALGLTAGLKLSAMTTVALLFCLVTWAMATEADKKSGNFIFYLLACCVLAAVFIPWPIREYMKTGYLFGFVPLQVAGVRLGAESLYFDWLKQIADLNPYDLKTEFRALANTITYIGWPTAAFLAVGIFGMAKLYFVNPKYALLAAAVLVGTLFAYFSPDFSYTRLMFNRLSGRFLLPAIVLSTVFSIYLLDSWRHLNTPLFIVVIIWSFLHMGLNLVFWPGLDFWLSLGVLAVLGLAYALWQSMPRFYKPILFIGFSMIVTLSLGLVRDSVRYSLLQRTSVFPNHARYWAEGAKILDQVAEPHRIAVTAGVDSLLRGWPLYYFLGRRYQNELHYIPATKDGSLAPLIAGIEKTADYASWRQRLLNANIDTIVTLGPGSFELEWMESHRNQFERLSGDGKTWGAYQVKKIIGR